MNHLPRTAIALGFVLLGGTAACGKDYESVPPLEVADAPSALDAPGDAPTQKTPDAPATSSKTSSKTSANTTPKDDSASAPDKKIADPSPLADGPVRKAQSSCQGNSGIVGNGTITRLTHEATNFTRVAADIAGDVVIQEGSSFRIQIETDANVQPVVTTDVANGVLTISVNGQVCLNEFRAIVTMPLFRGASLDGAGDVDITKRSAASDVDLALTGSGAIRFSGAVNKLTVSLEGAGDVHLAGGSATSTSVDLSGVGDVDSDGFSAGNVTSDVSGVGDVNL